LIAMTTNLDPLAEIKQLYFSATRSSIHHDLARAVSLLRRMTSDDERQRGGLHGRPLANAIGMERTA
jgi:hypothetical protein